ncbi:MAG: winged helix-turn-helix domain-containing protein [Candidatus Jordarchaeum sp.]|uniref:winged helix-turn-helix domain-containing protein n=1 Tax=Candidatus Jordarchaeum sp. TaxID=2823881 RepID=UPI0040491438
MANAKIFLTEKPEEIELIADHFKKRILELLLKEPMTLTQISKHMNINKSNTLYHLKQLKNAGLISVKKTEVEKHGIVQKFYQSNYLLFIPNYNKATPLIKEQIKRDTQNILIGFFVALSTSKKVESRELEEAYQNREKLAEELAEEIYNVSENLSEEESNDSNKEILPFKIYQKSFNELAKNSKELKKLSIENEH